MKLKFPIKIEKHKIRWDSFTLGKFYKHLEGFYDGAYELWIQKPEVPASDNQRKYYWAVIIGAIADSTGNDPISVHEYCKYMFLPATRDSTEALTSAEREKYHEDIRRHFNSEWDILIPLPNEIL